MQALSTLLHFISISGEEQLVGNCKTESPALSFPSHLYTRSLCFSISHIPICLFFPEFPRKIILIWIPTLNIKDTVLLLTHKQTNKQRVADILQSLCTLFSSAATLIRQWARKKKQAITRGCIRRQITAISIRPETVPTASEYKPPH